MSTTNIYSEIQVALKNEARVIVATVVKTMGAAPCPVGSKALIYENGKMQGSFAGPLTDGKVVQEALKALQGGQSYTTHVHLDADKGEAVGSCGATLEIFFEVLKAEPRLILAGAGYVSQALARLASNLDFRIIAIDDRKDLADPHAFSSQVQLTFGDIPQSIRDLEPDGASWIVIVTRGHNLDKEALRAAIESKASYVGMIGSPSKVKRIFRELRQEGIVSEVLAQVHAPIGLDIGADTPDEIALSIAAELVRIRKGGTGASLNTIHHLLEEEEVPV